MQDVKAGPEMALPFFMSKLHITAINRRLRMVLKVSRCTLDMLNQNFVLQKSRCWQDIWTPQNTNIYYHLTRTLAFYYLTCLGNWRHQ